jgi:pyruvate/2-oxoglutarate dehydrogenase complex dihydrolipoamide dehydrogenase (E3) component
MLPSMLHRIYRTLHNLLDPHREIRREAARHNLILVETVNWQVLDLDGNCLAIGCDPVKTLAMVIDPLQYIQHN